MKIEDILEQCTKLLVSKRHDYTSSTERHENFMRCEDVAHWFVDETDKVYVTLITVKLARLSVLLTAKEPKHESINDSFIDLINYCLLWADRRSQ